MSIQLQINNPVQPGVSGGPLSDRDGDLISIVVAMLDAKSVYENLEIIPQNANFATKSDYLVPVAEMILAYETMSLGGVEDNPKVCALRAEPQ